MKFEFKYIFSFVLLGSTFISCKTLNSDITYGDMVKQASSEAQETYQNPDFETCTPDDRKEFGDIILKNNLWGRSKLNNPELAQLCSYKKGDYFGWKWQLPDNASGVIGYPALQIGRNPFGKGTSNVAEFPVQVKAIKALPVSFDVETQVKHKKFNLSFDLWLANKEDYGLENITTEIMVWEDYFDFTSFGKKVANIITPFGTYDVLMGHLENPKFSQDWKYIAFVRNSPRSGGEVDLGFLLHYLVRNGHISESDYFTSIEFGNEIGNSSGYTLIKNFDWSLVTN